MVRYVLLLRFTGEGIARVKDSPSRAEAFQVAVTKAGGRLEAAYWTQGEYDGVAVFTAPDEATATTLVVDLGKRGFVRTRMLRAFNANEFKEILAKLP